MKISQEVKLNLLLEIEVKLNLLLEFHFYLKKKIEELFALAEQADRTSIPEAMSLPLELQLREQRLQKLAVAKAMLEERQKNVLSLSKPNTKRKRVFELKMR